MTGSNVKTIETVVNVFYKVRDLLYKQVQHNLYRIREETISELIKRTLYNILVINLNN